MIFATEHAIEDIISGKKTQTRRLVKEDDLLLKGFAIKFPRVERRNKNFKSVTKWQVGREYNVTNGRGKPTIWYCPKCKKTIGFINSPYPRKGCNCNSVAITENFMTWGKKRKKEYNRILFKEFSRYWKPLRIRITSISQENLLDISEEDAKKEGFENPAEFFETFLKINTKVKLTSSYFQGKPVGINVKENPLIWVISFEVVK